jgi:hypothetical protein
MLKTKWQDTKQLANKTVENVWIFTTEMIKESSTVSRRNVQQTVLTATSEFGKESHK